MRKYPHYLRVTIFIGLLSFGFHKLNAQNDFIRGFVKYADGNPAQNASVNLLKFADSIVVKEIFSDSLGVYYFRSVPDGEYLISVSFTGMRKQFTEVILMDGGNEQIGPDILFLKNSGIQLKDVTITAKRQMIEQKTDRMVINVKNSITDAGTTALDILEKSPGVTVNRQNSSIAINGKNGVSVMINGKLTYIPMEALVQFLSGVPAGNIDKLELITTPPSKYDAAGNGGYINIVLINNPYAGFNGSYFLTAGYNNRPLGAAGVNFNYKSGLVNLYGNYSFNHDHFIQPFTSFTQFTKNGNLISNATFSNRDATQDVQNLRLGIDYQLDSSTIIGVLLGGYNSRWTMIDHNGASISQNHVLDTAITATDDPEINHWQNVMANINFQHSFKDRKVLFLDANYIYYNDNNPNTYSTDYYNNSKKFLFHEDLKGDKITPIHFWVFAADYTAPVGGKITMETGAKLSYSTFTNEVGVNQLKQGKWVQDTSLSSKYQLNENLGAVYTSFTIQVNNKISVTAGLRYEYMESDLGTVKSAHLVNRHYGELFPTFYFSKRINPENSFNFSYSRRITRPAFNDLAPFTIFFDPKTYYSGNPALQPAIANSIQAGYGYKKFIFTISYTNESNTIDNFYFQMQRIDTLSGIVYLSARNFNYEKYLTTSFSLPFNLNRWWSMQNNLSGNWHQVKTSYDRAQLLLHYFDYSFTSIQRFELPKDFSIELTGFYSSASYLGTAKREPFYRLDAGIQKKFGNNADILRFAANDIFNSGGYYRFGEIVPGTGAIAIRTFNFGLVAYKITYTHNFGNRVLKGKRERSTGAEDELNRVHY